MIEDVIALGKAHFQPSFFQNPRINYALVIELKTKNGSLEYEKLGVEEISEEIFSRYMYRKGPSNQYDFTPSSILQPKKIMNTIERITKWAKDNQQIIPGLYEVLKDSKNKGKIKDEIANKIKGEKNPSYLLTIKIDGKYLSDILPKDFIKNRVIERCGKYEGYSSEGEGRCAVCGKEGKLYGLTLQTAGFVFYNVDKQGFAPHFTQEWSWRQVPLCEDCSLFLVSGKEFLDKYLKIDSGLGFNFYIVPSFLFKEESAIKKFEEKVEKLRSLSGKSLEELRGLIAKEDRIYEIIEKESDILRLNLLFFREKNKRFLILGYVQNLKPSWLNKLYKIQIEIMRNYIFSEEVMKKIFGKKKSGNFFKRIKKSDASGYIKIKEKYIPWWILALRNISFSQKEFLNLLSSILQRRKISYKYLLHKFNLFLQNSFKKQQNLSIDTLTTLSLYLFLSKLNLLEGENMREENKEKREIFDYEIFSNNERKHAFLIGALANYVLYVQRTERGYEIGKEPFRSKLNNLIIDQNKLKKIFVECVQKLYQYEREIPSWLPKKFKDLINIPEKWKSSVDEISYFFTLGLVLGGSLFKDKYQDNNRGDEDGEE